MLKRCKSRWSQTADITAHTLSNLEAKKTNIICAYSTVQLASRDRLNNKKKKMATKVSRGTVRPGRNQKSLSVCLSVCLWLCPSVARVGGVDVTGILAATFAFRPDKGPFALCDIDLKISFNTCS